MLGEERSNSNDKERLVQLAVRAFKKGQFKSVREAARAFGVNDRTLRRRLNGTPAKRDLVSPHRKLTDSEESVLVKYILDLNRRGFPPRLQYVTEMANLLIARDESIKLLGMQASLFLVAGQFLLALMAGQRMNMGSNGSSISMPIQSNDQLEGSAC
jgi:transposase-like protein